MSIQYEDQSPVGNAFQYLYRKEFRVTAALTISEYLSYKNGICVEDLKLWFDKWAVGVETEDIYNYQRWFYSKIFIPCRTEKPIDLEMIRAMSDVVNLSTIHWAQINYNIDYRILNEISILKKVHFIRNALDKAIKALQGDTLKENRYRCNDLNCVFTVHSDWVHITVDNGSPIILPWMALIACQESMIGMMDVIIYTRMVDLTTGTLHLPALVQSIHAAVSTICFLGKDAYTVLKSWLPAVVGNILDNEGSVYVNQLFTNVMNDLPPCELKTIWEIPLMRVEDKILAIKLSGINKIFSYPIVDIDSAVQNVREIGMQYKSIGNARFYGVWVFRKIWCRNYLRRHKVWPNLTYTNNINPQLLQAIQTNTWKEKENEWPYELFAEIKLGKNLEFNYFVDSSELLSDKSLAVSLPYWTQEYDRRYHFLKYGKYCKSGPPQTKRVIIKHLLTPHVNVKESILRVLKSKAGSPNRTSVMCIKEKELSFLKARYFTKLTDDMRLYQTALLANMKVINRYIPYQTMTMTGLALASMKIKISGQNDAKVHLDYRKWCLHQSHEINVEVCKEVDCIFDTPGMYEALHIIPQESYCFFQDRTNIPEQQPDGLPVLKITVSLRVLFGLRTQGEGMGQDIWTTNNICFIIYYLNKTGYKFIVKATGDNVQISVKLEAHMDPAKVQEDILNALYTMSEEIGLPLKMEETFTSSQYYEYGKDSYLNGKRVGAGMKKASRIGTETEANFPSLNNRISSIFSTGVATAGEDHLPIPAYTVSMVETLKAIQDVGVPLKAQHYSSMLIVSRALGGLKVSNYYSFCVRGIIDHPCWNLHLLTTLRDNHTLFPLVMKQILGSRVKLGKFKPSAVVKDPYVIPTNVPNDSEYWLREKIEDALPSFIINEEVKPLFNHDAVLQHEALLEDLLKIRPLSLKLISCIYQYSNLALQERFKGRFTSSSSVNLILTQELEMDMVNLYRQCKEEDILLITFLAGRGRNGLFKELLDDLRCPTEVLTDVRNRLAGEDLVTPTAPPVTHQVMLMKWGEVPEELASRAIKIIVSPSIMEYLSSKGPYRAYMGSETKVKKAKTSVEVLNPDSIDKTTLSVAELSSWIGTDAHIQALLDTLITEKTETPPGVVKESARQVVGGTFEHRGQLMILPTGAYINYDPNLYSHIEVITDTATEFAKSQKDYTIMFQMIKVAIASIIMHRHSGGLDVVGEFGAVLKCPGCTKLIYDGNYTMCDPPTYKGVHFNARNPILFENVGIQRFGGTGSPYEGAHAYLGEELATTILDWERFERILETDNADHISLIHNADINLSQIAQCNLKLLLTYLFANLSMHENLLTDITGLEFSKEKYVVNPAEVVMNTLIMAGHGSELVQILPQGTSLTLSNPYDRFRFFLSLWNNSRHSFIKNLSIVLPTDSPTVVYHLAHLKNDLGDHLDLEPPEGSSEADAFRWIMTEVGIRVAPPKDICIQELKTRVNKRVVQSLCVLPDDLTGNYELSLGPSSDSFATTLGLTVASSQLWSCRDALPLYPCLTLEDTYGSIGITLGHRGYPSYIHDTSESTAFTIRVNNGPEALYYDNCTASYDRSYYITNFGKTSNPKRPLTASPLIIIHKKDVRNTRYRYLYREGDTVISREPDTGKPLVGLPRRGVNDVWYMSDGDGEMIDYPSNDKLETPLHPVLYYNSCPLSPMKRLTLLLGDAHPTYNSAMEYIKSYIQDWEDISVNLDPIGIIEKRGFKRRRIINRGINEYLGMIWLRESISRGRKTNLWWHQQGDGTIHTNCHCPQGVKKKLYIYKDELVIYLIKSLPVI